jgi:hypothetical protein
MKRSYALGEKTHIEDIAAQFYKARLRRLG